ncbi:hypothetical protein J6S46_00640 [Candidatus Saccharibacteria bacterium]|nr:hypothetical protein [Candidatus Saccharibacteria bacterium]
MLKGMTKEEKMNLYWGLMFLTIALSALLIMVAMVFAIVSGPRARDLNRFGNIKKYEGRVALYEKFEEE